MGKKMTGFILSLIVIWLCLNVFMYVLQPRLLFFPDKHLVATPREWGMPYQDVWLTTADDVRIHAWYLPVAHARQVLLFFHGNAGNISHRGETLKLFHELGLSTLIIDYRGYGQSQGTVSEQGLYQDAQAAWQYLINEHQYQPQDIVIFGRSLGGAVATQLASKVQSRALILESTFSSIKDMAQRVLPYISRLIYLRYDFKSVSIINKVNSPVLVMHSPEDEMIPFVQGEKVYAAAQQQKQFYRLRGGHNETYLVSMPGYQQNLARFLNGLDK